MSCSNRSLSEFRKSISKGRAARTINRNQYPLKHTHTSWMITHANVNVSYLAQQMSHADITMVAKVYGKRLTESNKKESNRVWSELERLQNN